MMARTKNTKVFYNKEIPNDWDVKPVGVAFKICNNLRLPISEEERAKMKGNFPYYGPTKIQDYINEYRIEGKYALIGEDGDHFLKWKELPMTLLVEGKFNVNNHAHIIQGEENLTEWFFYYFNQKELTPHLTRQGAGRYKLTKDTLSKILCPLPPLPEQKAITSILGTWDMAIQKTGQLIVQKEQRKKWLMQQLLTGKKRLKGFGGKWKEMAIGDLISESKIPSTENDANKRLTVKLNLRGIEKRDFRGSEAEDATYFFIRKKGQFIYGKQNLHKGAFGIIPEDLDAYESSQDIPSFDFKAGVIPIFFLLFLSQENFYKSLEKISTGTGSKRIHPDNLYKVRVNFPLLKEQTAIAKVLQAADKEIGLLKAKDNKLREQKKGLMQQLLTGKVRLKID
ncbi:restriction endonuclease subunit S [Edaphocola aurantiacus]|uniref:restriction endonuclease subunit S n=1 Tax=Edaphocola aurantiacus TaxID=2601682 RepID=UPI001C94C253|nr:restriction endonuclease subunit S [Edaphocola aurantiacus]